MSSLETNILDFKFPNPFILASGPAAGSAEKINRAFELGWGGVVTETIKFDLPTPLVSESHEIRSGRLRWGRIENLLASTLTASEWEVEVQRVRASYPERPLIASITAGDSQASWVELASRLSNCGITAFEINGNLPNFPGRDPRLFELGQDPEALARVVHWVFEATQKPVIVKLSPNVTDILLATQAALEAGAVAFTTTGGLRGIGGIDVSDFSTIPSLDSLDMAGTYTGPGLKPVALRWAAVLSKAVKAPIVGCGGVSTWQDAIEYFSVGASAVQVDTAVEWHGIEIIDELMQGLEGYLQDHGFSNPAEIRGKSLPFIVGFDELDLEYKLLATLEESECIGCDLCVRACNDGGFQAISMVDKIAVVDPAKCDGCGLCIYVCPPDIMSLVPVDQISTN